jgi:hypothetical protein
MWRVGVPIVAVALAAALAARAAGPEPAGQSRYPAFGGQWIRNIGAQWDASRPRGPLGQQAPLTAEYQAIFEANSAELFSGGELYNPQIKCLPGGMPRMMIAYEPIEFIVTADTTYIWVEQMGEFRRIYTDGRAWPKQQTPAFRGYSIGRWIDAGGAGRYDTLLVETRNLKGPRTFDADGLPLHADDQTIVNEAIYLDRTDPNLLRDDVTTFDHALTRPYTVARTYRRELHPLWPEEICDEDNHHVNIGTESYFISDDGHLMPTRKGQRPPELRGFDRPGG